MFGSRRVKLDKRLIERARQTAERAGYSSLDEFVAHTLERAVAQSEEAEREGEDEVKRRLKGLGYLS
jgi:hypothetical protein